ncbi:MAG: transcription termination/antitermination NusG family protein [Candidatus Zophobacter franzmannii]|nr:transcription termination/antitermination NusG family protein [Candidatus Zophobacter franzmannii]
MATHKPVEVLELFGELTPSNSGYRWRVIYTKSRVEKKLAEYAHRLGINYYLPLIDSVKDYKYRKVTFTKPLFPGYIFIKANSEDISYLYNSGCISSILKVNNESNLLKELNSIYRLRSKGAIMSVGKYLDEGVRVRILSGPFEGLTGFVESHETIDKVILNVEIIHQSIVITVNSIDIKIIGDRGV